MAKSALPLILGVGAIALIATSGKKATKKKPDVKPWTPPDDEEEEEKEDPYIPPPPEEKKPGSKLSLSVTRHPSSPRDRARAAAYLACDEGPSPGPIGRAIRLL